jgi:octaheme c-type cytochrome (tetrathionate reductase family)
MKNFRFIWVVGLVVTLAIITIPLVIFWPKDTAPKDDPWAHVPVRPPHTDHTALLPGPFENPSDVTRACLECHPDAASDLMKTTHWTWESDPVMLPGRSEPVTIGKKNSLNNFCLGIRSNWPGCTTCHAGYGWSDESFDFTNQELVDCLVCHDSSGLYVKSKSGLPAEGVDLAAAAQSVTTPSRDNCGSCHFDGGGGNGVKHADLDEHLYNPTDELDVHMGKNNFICIDCHQTKDHLVSGRALSTSITLENQIYCTDCHIATPHADERLNNHTSSVACQTCHIPYGAIKDPTKVDWDWSTAGQDLPEDPHEYLKIKGSFIYEKNLVPEYYWFSGMETRYIVGDIIDPSKPTVINQIAGDIHDPNAKIFPFKVHRARQPYDTVYNYLLQPKTVGEGGFWTTFDWKSALEAGSKAIGIEFSGQYGFAETEMYWPITHLVAPKERALQCESCHGPNGRLDWQALGYPGDPIEWGGRDLNTGLTISAGK